MASTVDSLHPPTRGVFESAITDPASRDVGTRSTAVPLQDLPRELGRIVGDQPGPTLLCIGGLHGNEPAGVLAIQRVMERLSGAGEHLRGELIGVVGNRHALGVDRRYIDHDLNRAWKPERLSRLLESTEHREIEDREQVELADTLRRVIDEAPGRVFALDLHTTSGPGSAFAILDDTLPNREIAMDFPVPLVLGLEEELSGTLASHLTALGVTVLGFEAGQHTDPTSVDRAEAAIWLALDSCGLLQGELRQRARSARQTLEKGRRAEIRIVEVLSRHHIDRRDGFIMLPGFASFQTVTEGQLLARENGRPILAPRSGMLLMPLYQDLGEDGFFLVQEVRPVWLAISRTLRGWRLERALHLLPGVSQDPNRSDTFIVDRRLARWFALRLFHLLGFRRDGKDGTTLVMTRRRDFEV